MSTTHDGPERAEILLVTKDMAENWLAKNSHNRPLNPLKIGKFKRAIQDGKFRLNGETIIIGRDGSLMDGQNRLMAVVETGMAIWSFVIFDVDPTVFATIDGGSPRSNADILSMSGEADGKPLAKALSALARFDSPSFANQQLTSIEALDLLVKNPAIRQSLPIGNSVKEFIPAALGCAAHYLFRKSNTFKANSFFEVLAKGESENNAALQFRELMRKNRTSAKKLQATAVAGLLVKAWNFYQADEVPKILRYSVKDQFPDIKGRQSKEAA